MNPIEISPIEASAPLACIEPRPRPVPGNEEFAEIYETYARLMRLIAVRDFRVPFSDAEGIVHDIFMHYFSNPGVVRGELKPYFRDWLFMVLACGPGIILPIGCFLAIGWATADTMWVIHNMPSDC